MKRMGSVIFLGLWFIFGAGYLNAAAEDAAVFEQESFKEDLEVIENLDFLDDLDLFDEDLDFLENYNNIYQSEETGDGYE